MLSAVVGLSGIVITRFISGLAATNPAVLANVSTSTSDSGHARCRLGLSGVVSSRSPKRRRENTRIRDGTATIMIFRRTVLAVHPDESLAREQPAQSIEQISPLFFFIRKWRLCAPNRPGPGGISPSACNYVYMQLRHLVAESGNVELVALGRSFERSRDRGDLAKQLHLCVLLKIDELNEPGQARHQDQPGIVCVVRQ